MADVEIAPLDSPDETRTFDKGKLELGNVGGATSGVSRSRPVGGGQSR